MRLSLVLSVIVLVVLASTVTSAALDAPPSAQQGEVTFVDREHEPGGIAEVVEISGDGSAGFARWTLNNQRIAKYDPEQGPLWEQPGRFPPHGDALAVDADGSTVMAAMRPLVCDEAAGCVPRLVVGLAQLVTWRDGAGPEPTTTETRAQPLDGTVVAAASADGSVAVASGVVPQETKVVGRSVVAVYEPGSQTGPTWVTTGDVGQPVGDTTQSWLLGVDISGDGSTVAVSHYANILVYRLPDTDPVAVIPNGSQTVARLTDDGAHLAMGGFKSEAHLYAWDGTTYDKRWSRNLGHRWVTAVAVADDGTVVAGTQEPAGERAGKVVALAPQDGSVLWECLCYADRVNDVDVTPDGSRAVAASYGERDSTDPHGDVFTAFDVATGGVLFRLRSGVDEPGSLLSTAISDDGTRVLAGGQERHATMASQGGGMVYGIVLAQPGPTESDSPIPTPTATGDTDAHGDSGRRSEAGWMTSTVMSWYLNRY